MNGHSGVGGSRLQPGDGSNRGHGSSPEHWRHVEPHQQRREKAGGCRTRCLHGGEPARGMRIYLCVIGLLPRPVVILLPLEAVVKEDVLLESIFCLQQYLVWFLQVCFVTEGTDMLVPAAQVGLTDWPGPSVYGPMLSYTRIPSPLSSCFTLILCVVPVAKRGQRGLALLPSATQSRSGAPA